MRRGLPATNCSLGRELARIDLPATSRICLCNGSGEGEAIQRAEELLGKQNDIIAGRRNMLLNTSQVLVPLNCKLEECEEGHGLNIWGWPKRRTSQRSNVLASPSFATSCLEVGPERRSQLHCMRTRTACSEASSTPALVVYYYT
jgi:hypothetical protein